MTSFFLKPHSPFRLDLTVWALRRRPENLVDRWDGQTYRRVLPLQNGPVEVEVTQRGAPESARLRVTVEGRTRSHRIHQDATAALDRLLGIHCDLSAFYQLASGDATLRPLVNRFRGMKPPRFATVFEGAVTAIANQQVSLNVGILLLGRLASKYGASVRKEDAEAHAFPEPKDLATVHPEDLRQLGFSGQKGRAIVEMAKSIVAGDLDLEALTSLPDEEAIERLLNIRGIGRWSAEYVLLRGMGRTNIFPGDDVGARNNLERFLNIKKPLDYLSTNRVLARWRPHAGLIYFHLLLDRLSEAGYIEATAERRHGNRAVETKTIETKRKRTK